MLRDWLKDFDRSGILHDCLAIDKNTRYRSPAAGSLFSAWLCVDRYLLATVPIGRVVRVILS